MGEGNQVLFRIQSVSVDVDWNASIRERPTRDISKDLTGFPSLQEDAPSLKRGFLERKTSDLKNLPVGS